mmetsp:Transcript_14511/g.16459  ORF Transcript_14511/g.16459 Transcript_14511/m.16459 type:complete len:221 (+) Transcript_14511:221-883(+)
MGKNRRKGVRKPQGRYITSAEEMRARNEVEVKEGRMTQAQAEMEEDANSDLDFLSGDEDNAHKSEEGGDSGVAVAQDPKIAELIEKMRQPMEKEAPLTTAALIETANPNAMKKQNIKLKDLKNAGPQELSRKEREFIEAQREKRELARKTALGQTVEAKNDLERLAEIRRERERAKQRREEEAKKKEELRLQAAERAAQLDNKITNSKGKKGRKGGKKKR